MAVGMEVMKSQMLHGINFRSSSSSPIPISSHHLHSRGATSPVQSTISLVSTVSFLAQSLTCTCQSQKSSLPVSFLRKNCSSLAVSNAFGHYPLLSRGWRAAALNLNPLELRQRRSDFFKVLKTSASSVLSWLRRRRRTLEIRPVKLLMTSPALRNVFRIRLQSTSSTAGKFDESGALHGRLSVRCHSSLSVSSQAEGNENTFVLPEERQEQYQVQQQEKADPVGGFLATGYGWRVRAVARGELQELIRVADIQTAAFHERVALFDDLFYKIFHAEVLSSLQYKARNFAVDKYSCLLAERDPTQPGYIDEFQEEENELAIVGAVDCTALMEGNIVSHLPGAEEYLYISGMAVDSNYRRQSVATLLLEACLARAWQWGFDYLVLHAYEDDLRARSLYSRAGYLVVASDPAWMSKFFGRRRRVIMAKRTHKIPEC